MLNFQKMISRLTDYWASQGCVIHQGYDLEVGAGTFNPATFLRCLGPEPYRTVYVEPSRRPQDGRYGENPNRVQSFHQMQVILKPSPSNLQEIYLKSLEAIGFDLKEHDIRFVHDDWENPTIGAWGLGWEVWMDGMEVTQFTYFQSVGGIPVKPVSGEITYGLERLAMFMQKKHSFFDLEWNEKYTYGDLFKGSEWEWSRYNFEASDATMWFRHFDDFEAQAKFLSGIELPIPAYDFVMKASHAFNMLDARGVISVTERTSYIARIRNLAEKIAHSYILSREKQGFPLLNNYTEEPMTITIPPPLSNFNPKEKRDFLFEIGSEELPATFVPIGMHNLKTQVSLLFEKEGLTHGEIQVYGSPRRLAVLVKDLICGTKTITEERRGPKFEATFEADGTLTRAGEGFFKSIGHQPITAKELKKGCSSHLKVKNGYLYAIQERPGKATRSILARELPNLMTRLDFPKKMRWGTLKVEYPRPLRWIVALLGKDTISFEIANLVASNQSFGHRQRNPVQFVITTPSDYTKLLKKHDVIVDAEERRESILNQLTTIEKKHHIKSVATERVLPQVVHLTEKPELALATFDQNFLKAPSQVLISEMVEHQKYFPMSNETGSLVSFFVVVCDNAPNKTILTGNQNALSPRLADGVFLYEEDLKISLENLNKKMTTITYQKALGSMFEKVKRMVKNVEILHEILPICDLKKAKRAAYLSKADLASHLVGEFPELQGTCGKLYALHHKEDQEVAIAIEEHWMPRGEKAPLPQTPVGLIVSMADKLDNLISCFALNLLPTSSSDPYALRRQGLGLLRSMIEHKLSLNLLPVLDNCFDAFIKSHHDTEKYKTKKEEILTALKEFLLGRAKTVFYDLHFEKDEVDTILFYDHLNIFKNYELLLDLQAFRKEETFLRVHETFTRIRKILGGQSHKRGIDEKLFKEPVERALYAKLVGIKRGETPLERFRILGEFGELVDAFFNGAKVMEEDEKIRTNRLGLLFELAELFMQDIDFSKLHILPLKNKNVP